MSMSCEKLPCSDRSRLSSSSASLFRATSTPISFSFAAQLIRFSHKASHCKPSCEASAQTSRRCVPIHSRSLLSRYSGDSRPTWLQLKRLTTSMSERAVSRYSSLVRRRSCPGSSKNVLQHLGRRQKQQRTPEFARSCQEHSRRRRLPQHREHGVENVFEVALEQGLAVGDVPALDELPAALHMLQEQRQASALLRDTTVGSSPQLAPEPNLRVLELVVQPLDLRLHVHRGEEAHVRGLEAQEQLPALRTTRLRNQHQHLHSTRFSAWQQEQAASGRSGEHTRLSAAVRSPSQLTSAEAMESSACQALPPFSSSLGAWSLGRIMVKRDRPGGRRRGRQRRSGRRRCGWRPGQPAAPPTGRATPA
eukprot:754110-Rhodomonas_salina.2